MFRGMRRKAQLLSEEETIKIFEKGTSGVLAVLGDEDYPYAVPLSYIYCDSKIYFHGAKSGHMLDSILKHEKVSFCVIDEDKVVPEEYTTYFRSAIAFGKVRVIDNENEKRNAIEKLAVRYTPNDEEGRLKKIEREYKILCMFELDIEHMTGKEAMKLVREKKKK
ncbi:pyridoxamine 5'-phosphate oxidase family protein [Clostridium culturomicium]|uniref:pyridoxamine 5'-phosphate oxidase family protein n=1 Tax=Clostridium culturomicium TaxID=1499683 RepID=UPI00058C1589|nr:pyridoxamine 5'-phosphate oxidase family protein [Clostridium culturomicium]